MNWKIDARRKSYLLFLGSLSLLSIFNAVRFNSQNLFRLIDIENTAGRNAAALSNNDAPIIINARTVAIHTNETVILRRPERPPSKSKYCCMVKFHQNIGHALTDTVLDFHRCGVVAPYDRDPGTVDRQLQSVAKLLNTTISSRNFCLAYYNTINPASHPRKGRLQAYSQMKIGYRNWYDAVPVAHRLRDIQKAILSSCSLEPPSFRNDDGSIAHLQGNNPYDSRSERPPSGSVLIVKREPMRKLLNVDEVLNLCKQLDLDCRIFEANSFFQTENYDNNDEHLCRALHEFNKDHPLVIGVQGAEITYALLSGLRLFLMATIDDYVSNPGCRILNNSTYNSTLLLEGEDRVASSLVCRGLWKGTDAFFPEIAMSYGATIHLIRSAEDLASGEKWKSLKKLDCAHRPFYCADRTADIIDMRKNLERLIRDGSLLTRKRKTSVIQ